jgi:hypothetical protein
MMVRMAHHQIIHYRTFCFLRTCMAIALCVFGSAEVLAAPNQTKTKITTVVEAANYYNTVQTIRYSGKSTSFEQNVIAFIVSDRSVDPSGQTYTMSFNGWINYPSERSATLVASEEVIMTRNNRGKIKSEQPSLVHSVQVINEAVDWAIAHKLPENKPVQVPLGLGNGITSHFMMTFDLEPVQIGATKDTRLVTVKTKPRMVSGISGLFECSFKSIFVYSPNADKLYQSTSIFTASKGSESVRIEELTYLATKGGKTPRYAIVDSQSRIGALATKTNDGAMSAPPAPWVIEALAARDSLYCATKAIAYEKTNWVYLSAFITDTTYSLMNYAWFSATGKTLVASVVESNPSIGFRLNRYDVEGIAFTPSTIDAATILAVAATPKTESKVQQAKVIKITPDTNRVKRTIKPIQVAPETDWLMTLGLAGGGIAAMAGMSGSSSGGGGGGACAGIDLGGSYDATVTSPCMGDVVQDILFDLALNNSCSVTGTAIVFGGAPVAVDATNWSYTGGMLSIGGFSGAVASDASTFTTPLESVFPALAMQIEALVDLLPPAEIQDIIDTCGSVSAYISNLTMTWTKV